MKKSELANTSTAQAGTALKAVFNILDRWNCSNEQQRALLQLPRSSYYKLRSNLEGAKLNADQVERISYLLNIHAALRLIFENPENVYGYMGMQNDNPPFNGKAPLELLGTGRFGPLYETFKHVDAMRGGLW